MIEKLNHMAAALGVNYHLSLTERFKDPQKPEGYDFVIRRNGNPLFKRRLKPYHCTPIQLNPPTSHLGLLMTEDFQLEDLIPLNEYRIGMMWEGYGLLSVLPYKSLDDYEAILNVLSIGSLKEIGQPILAPSGETFIVQGLEGSKIELNKIILYRTGNLNDYLQFDELLTVLEPFMTPKSKEKIRPSALQAVGEWSLFEVWNALVKNRHNCVINDIQVNPSEQILLRYLLQGIPLEFSGLLIKS